MIKNNFINFTAVLMIFLMMVVWVFSGWPRIWQKPPIPPEVLTTRAASPEAFAYTGSTQYFNPANGIYGVTVECWGGGGGGGKVNNDAGGGGGGGAYAKSTNVSVAPGSSYPVVIGAGGATEVVGATSTFNSTIVVAVGGGRGFDKAKGTGGSAASCTGNSIKSSGGNGGDGYDDGTTGSGGGAGGAGGPDGGGKSATNASAGTPTSGADANNSVGTGTGGAAVDNGQGNPGNNDLTKGGGGGAGSEGGYVGAAGGVPGGGGGGGSDNANGGAGGHGRCIVSYTDTWAPSASSTVLAATWFFSSIPTSSSPTQIDMTAVTGYDANTISYFFTFSACPSNGGTNGDSSSWQTNTSYSDSGLQPNQCYGYTVQAKDSLGNTGTVSTASSTYALANAPSAPTLNGATSNTLNLTNNENGNPSSNPTTYFAAQVVTPASDATWYLKWVDASGNPSNTKVYLTDAQLTNLTLNNLQSATTYGVKIKARNNDGAETALSAEGQGATEAAANQAPSITSVSLNSNSNIILNEGTWKSASTTIAISDADYCSDISSVTAKLYHAATTTSGTTCTPNDNNCYLDAWYIPCVATTTGNTCGASDTTVEYDCGFHVWYIADPTDAGTYAGDIWAISATTTDSAAHTVSATNTQQLIEVISQNALSTASSISYGTVITGGNTGSTNQQTTVTNTGNTAIDTQVDAEGDYMCTDYAICSGAGNEFRFAVTNQEFSLSAFAWGNGTDLTNAVQEAETSIAKPTSTTTPQTCSIYWGIGIPQGTPVGIYTGQTNFNAKTDD